MKRKLRLSQCMIVKNEEDNIRRALSWGKGIVCEQIVVDTGSEDQTVSIAESMGAKVFHYQWEDDFSAAKNFAISKATGDWIAFLDADEYFIEEDLGKLKKLLDYLASFPTMQQPDAVRCNMLHIGIRGNVFSTTRQDRLLKNNGKILYKNRIHEMLTHTSGRELLAYDVGDELSIYHTGYAYDVTHKKNKSERNLNLLLKELEQHPDRYELWSYVGDAFMGDGEKKKALEAYRKVIDHPEAQMQYSLRLNSFANTARIAGVDPSFSLEDLQELYRKYQEVGIVHPDMEYWTGLNYLRFGQKKEGIRYLEKALETMEKGDFPYTLYITGEQVRVYRTLVQVCAEEKENGKAVRYAVLALRADRYQEDVLNTLLKLFQENGESAAGVYGFLGKIYGFNSSKDVFFVYKAAKLLRFYRLEDYIYRTMSESEIAFLEKEKENPYRLTKEQREKNYPSVTCRNAADVRFLELMEEIRKGDAISMVLKMTNALRGLEARDRKTYDAVLDFYEKNAYWGKLIPDQEEYGTFWLRAELMKNYPDKILRLYAALSDYRSRRVLCALLENWLHLESAPLKMAGESSLQVFDPDLMPDASGKRFVDFWATEGNDVRSFLQAYGDAYEQILCYVRSEEDALKLTCNLRGVRRLQVLEREKGNVSINKDISGPVGFIRLHGEGTELQLLDCCSAQLAAYRPALIVSAYYGYESVFELADRILQINPSYKLYLRYYGDEYVTSDYYLIAV